MQSEVPSGYPKSCLSGSRSQNAHTSPLCQEAASGKAGEVARTPGEGEEALQKEVFPFFFFYFKVERA